MIYQRDIFSFSSARSFRNDGGSQQRQRPAHNRAEHRIGAHEEQRQEQRQDRHEYSGRYRFLPGGLVNLGCCGADLPQKLAGIGLGHGCALASHANSCVPARSHRRPGVNREGQAGVSMSEDGKP